MDAPKRLYKYQPVSSYALKNLKNNHLFFNDPSNFNDPYDTNHEIDIKPLTKENAKNIFFGKGTGREIFERLESNLAGVEDIEIILKLLTQKFPSFRLLLFRNTNLIVENSDKSISLIGRIDEEKISELSFLIVSAYYESLNGTLKTALEVERKEKAYSKGVCCFSEVFDDLLMWSYYADGHKGICLEFDTTYDPFTKVHKVNYVTEIPAIDANIFFDQKMDLSGVVEAFLATKYFDWNHEHEWRVIHDNNNQTFGYKTNALTGIYFGSKIDFTTFEIIALIIKGQHTNCSFYQMEKVPGEFKIIPKKITYSSFQEAKDIVFKDIKLLLERGERDLTKLILHTKLNLSESRLSTIIEAIIDDIELKR